MASGDIGRFQTLLCQRPNTQPLHSRVPQPTPQEVSHHSSPNFQSKFTNEGSEGGREQEFSFLDKTTDSQSNRSSVEPNDNFSGTSQGSLCSSPSTIDFPYPPSQYVAPSILKRKLSEDLTAFTEDQIRAHGLQGHDAEGAIKCFAHYTLEQKLIVVYTGQKKQKIDIDRMIKASNGPWNPLSSLINKIRKFTYLVLVDPSLSSYSRNVPIELVMNILKRYPRMGYTSDIATDYTKQAAVEKVVSEQLITVRNEFKSIIQKYTSPDSKQAQKDINSLCRAILTVKSKVAPRVRLTINMTARFAYLRGIYLEYSGHNYWMKVDSSLEAMRKQYSAEEISRCFAAILDEDRETYPLTAEDKTTPELPFNNFAVEDHIEESEGLFGRF